MTKLKLLGSKDSLVHPRHWAAAGAAIALAALGLAASLAALLFIGGEHIWKVVGSFPLHGVVCGVASMILSAWSKGARLSVLARASEVAVSQRSTFAVGLASDAAFVLTPFGLGGYAATIFLLMRRGASTAQGAAIMAAEQALDLAFFAVTIPLATAAAVVSYGSFTGPPKPLIAIAIAAIPLLVLLFVRRRNAIATEWTAPTKKRRIQRIARVVAESALRLSALLSAGRDAAIHCALLTVMLWISRYGALYIVLDALGHGAPFLVVFVAQAIAMSGANLSGIPAGGGGADLALTAMVSPWVTPYYAAPALVVWRGLTLFLPILAGAVAWGALLSVPTKNPAPN